MFAVLPPPRPTNGVGTTVILETNNILTNPTGLDLIVGEGTYVLRDDLSLATPPPHPTDVPVPNSNPLAPSTRPPTSGTKVSAVVLVPAKSEPASGLFRVQDARQPISSIQEEPHTKSDSQNGFGTASYYNAVPNFGEGNPALLAPAPVKGKKKEEKAKPKTNMVKSNSSFVSRVLLSDSITKRLAERSPAGILAFANVNRALFFLDLAATNKTDYLAKVLFTKAHALCHHVNPLTKSNNHIDVILGFNTSDVIWYEPFSQKYTRINKNGAINASPVFDIQWLPNKENLFIAAHADGTLAVYDREKEDADFVSEISEVGAAPSSIDGSNQHDRHDNAWLHVLKSVKSANQKCNPVAVWKVAHSRINKIAFSPDGQHLAVVSEEGTLTVLDYINERVLDVYRSFYGALLAVTWSPDGRYVLTGGQDDLVSIWSFADQTLIARCVGHESWIRDVKFDPWRCDERNYRFGSVGEDCRLLLWDFSVGMLGRPKMMSVRNIGSLSSSSLAQAHNNSTTRLRSTSNLTQQAELSDQQENVVHNVDGKATTPILPPIISKIVGDQPLCWLGFQDNSILTSCSSGHIKEWIRPEETITNETSRI